MSGALPPPISQGSITAYFTAPQPHVPGLSDLHSQHRVWGSGEGWGAGCRAVVQRASSEHTEFAQVRGGQEENPGGILHVPSFTEGL